jgi:hypothetical protein
MTLEESLVMRVNRKNVLITFAAAATATFIAAPAAASVLSWSYLVDARFNSATHTDGDASGFTVTPTSIIWGDPGGSLSAGGGQSGLLFTDTPDDGTVDTGEARLLDIVITHANNPVGTEWAMLGSGEASITFDLEATSPDGEAGSVDPIVFTFPFAFLETPNSPASGICADGTAVGAFGFGCRDIFAVSGNTSAEFEHNGQRYLLSLFGSTEEAEISAEHCSLLGLTNGCFGVLTRESLENSARFGFSVALVPEPKVLALFGLGVLGLGFAMRRRRAF